MCNMIMIQMFIKLLYFIITLGLCSSITLHLEETSPSFVEETLSKYWLTHDKLPSSYKVLRQVTSGRRHKRATIDSKNVYSSHSGATIDIEGLLRENIQFHDQDLQVGNEEVFLNLTLKLPLKEDELEITLHPRSILHPHFVYSLEDEFGGVTEKLLDDDNCVLTSDNIGGTWAVISSCSSLIGIVSHNGEYYHIEELHLVPEDVDDVDPIYIMYQLTDHLTKGLLPTPPQAIKTDDDDSERTSRRTRRRVNNGDYIMEVAVFVDKSLFNYIKKRFPNENDEDRTIEVVMTLINAVHILYSSDSLGKSKIKMQLKKIHLLAAGEVHHEDGDVYSYLEKFCFWQSNQNSQKARKHWDHAILLTAKDLWSNNVTHNSTVGLAYVKGMCTWKYSCTINEATSFAGAYIIAHEIGHNLGAQHDTGSAGCENGKYLMSDIMSSGATEWSKCSRDEISNFLYSGGECLLVTPITKVSGKGHTGDLPGMRFNANQQCNYMYGNEWSSFHMPEEPFNNICKEIWCRYDNQLKTPAASALEGTKCGTGKVCISGTCKQSSHTPSITTKQPTVMATPSKNSVFKFFDNANIQTVVTKHPDKNVIYNIGGDTPDSGSPQSREDKCNQQSSSILGKKFLDFLNSFLGIFGLKDFTCGFD